jgi:hypothetical protein
MVTDICGTLKCSREHLLCTACFENELPWSGLISDPSRIPQCCSTIQTGTMHKKSDTQLIHLASHSRYPIVPGYHQRPGKTAWEDGHPTKRPHRHAISPVISSPQHFYHSIVGQFWVSTCMPMSTPTKRDIQVPMSNGAHVVIPLAPSSTSLASSLFAVSAMYLGRQRNDVNLRDLALASYGSALCRFRPELVCIFDTARGRSRIETVMATALTLTLFEVFLQLV